MTGSGGCVGAAEDLGGGPGLRAGWDAFLAAVRPARRGSGLHGGRVEGGDMSMITDLAPGAVRGEPVPGDHDPCRG